MVNAEQLKEAVREFLIDENKLELESAYFIVEELAEELKYDIRDDYSEGSAEDVEEAEESPEDIEEDDYDGEEDDEVLQIPGVKDSIEELEAKEKPKKKEKQEIPSGLVPKRKKGVIKRPQIKVKIKE